MDGMRMPSVNAGNRVSIPAITIHTSSVWLGCRSGNRLPGGAAAADLLCHGGGNEGYLPLNREPRSGHGSPRLL